MKVVILCGGKGTRLREETEYRPKPMVPIGGRPILWHIMKTYAHHGHKDFILCLGYKGDMIKDYFRNYLWHTCDTTLRLGRKPDVQFHNRHDEEDWSVTLAETGENSMTAYRVRQIEKYLGDDEHFLLTYGDGVGEIDIPGSIKQHRGSGKACTLTAVHPPGRFGELGLTTDNTVRGFNEKPQAEGGYINSTSPLASPPPVSRRACASAIFRRRIFSTASRAPTTSRRRPTRSTSTPAPSGRLSSASPTPPAAPPPCRA